MHLLSHAHAHLSGKPRGPEKLEMAELGTGPSEGLAAVMATPPPRPKQGWVAHFISQFVPKLTVQCQQGALCAVIKL